MILESHCQLEQNCLTTGAGNCSVWTRSIFIVCDPTADCGVGNAKLVIAQLRLQLVNPFSAFVAMEGLWAFSWRGLANSIQLELRRSIPFCGSERAWLMSILDVVALYQAREIMLRWFDSTPKFLEEGPVDWALLCELPERVEPKMNSSRVARQSRKRGLIDEASRLGY